MSDIRVKAYKDGANGLQPIFIDANGEEVDLDSKNCGARSADGRTLRCTLDVHHRLLGTKHLARTPEGQLIAF